jgi:hypothetical protein
MSDGQLYGICDTGFMSDPNEPGSVPPDEPFMPPSQEPDIASPGTPTPPLGTPQPTDGATTLPEITPMSDPAPASDPAPDPAPASDPAPGYPEATTQMPVAGAAGAMPPGTSRPCTGFGEPLGSEPPTPWYKKPVPIIALLIVCRGGGRRAHRLAVASVVATTMIGRNGRSPVCW